MLVAIGLGAGGVLRAHPWIHEALRWVGAAYLLWLAWHIASARPGPPEDPATAAKGRPLGFLRAALFQWVNPKAWVIALGAVVTYTTASGAALVAQAALIAGLFAAVTLPVTALYTLAGWERPGRCDRRARCADSTWRWRRCWSPRCCRCCWASDAGHRGDRPSASRRARPNRRMMNAGCRARVQTRPARAISAAR